MKAPWVCQETILIFNGRAFSTDNTSWNYGITRRCMSADCSRPLQWAIIGETLPRLSNCERLFMGVEMPEYPVGVTSNLRDARFHGPNFDLIFAG